jgi:hypothetical protein
MTRRPHAKIEAAFDVQQGVWALDAFTPAQGHEQTWFREGNQISIALSIIDVMTLDTYKTKSAIRLIFLPSQCLPSPDLGMRKPRRFFQTKYAGYATRAISISAASFLEL